MDIAPSPLADTMLCPLPVLGLFQVIPASIRQRIPSLYPSVQLKTGLERTDLPAKVGRDWSTLRSVSEPELDYYGTEPIATAGDLQRPQTAGSTAVDQVSCHSRVSGKHSDCGNDHQVADSVSLTANYEPHSGIGWNRVTPALSLLQNCGNEARRPNCDGRLARSLFLHALGYLLGALPDDLSPDEATSLKSSIPGKVKRSIAPSSVGTGHAPGSMTRQSVQDSVQPSCIHRLLAFTIIQFSLLVHFLMPYIKVLLQNMYQYERSHRITERVFSTALGAADHLGKGGCNLGSRVMTMQEGKLGAKVSGAAAWWMEGVAGGVCEGVGEGMAILGFTRPDPDSTAPAQSPES
ncbi:hypothetical protein P168DRAFT_287203 [Aspergillus campestris IBT 28561]|uniref:Uncharacterized protein n=1 Tax=Aspergillus campestris (strain IBT 28561) TaxID=1392248 RepID=A0A2I1DGY8_ASPC2|nr:uncharacterized protein P168DRAFT_287203 [Aspergillus campestris IBT 28561]PKY09130.1 hypothetical protein P168DRAFT_287203 [Aspergillus campestris IBT 28561]